MAQIHKFKKRVQNETTTVYPVTVTDAVVDPITGQLLSRHLAKLQTQDEMLEQRIRDAGTFQIGEVRRVTKGCAFDMEKHIRADGSAIFLQDYPGLRMPAKTTTSQYLFPMATDPYKVCAGNGIIMVLTISAESNVYTMPDNSATWTHQGALGFKSIVFANGVFYGIHEKGIKKSTNGSTWTSISTNLPVIDNDVEMFEYQNGTFVIYYKDNWVPKVFTSTNCTKWTAATGLPENVRGSTHKKEAHYGNGIFAFTDTGTGDVFYTRNFRDWVKINNPGGLSGVGGILFAGELFIIEGDSGVEKVSTADFVTYKKLTVSPHGIIDVAFHNGLYVATTYGLPSLLVSSDGEHWCFPVGEGSDIVPVSKIIWANGAFWIFFRQGTYSYDGRIITPNLCTDNEDAYIKVR